MFTKTIQYYDLIYDFKDYENESRQIVNLIKREHPAARSILDVGCGTAEHAKHLSRTYQVDGIDIASGFIDIARNKVPTGRFWVADMSAFEVGIRYDVVQCLFSSIGYLTQPEQVVDALVCFKKHLNPEGIIIVEPWFSPDQWKVGFPHMLVVDQPDLKICRMNTTEREGILSRMTFHFLIGKPQGVEHFTEDHELALYTVDEMLHFFNAAGLAVRYDPEGIFGRGLYVAIVQREA
jgi:ubiquinone/menaquinone biosynthesis C-methylase UbiE